MTLVFVMSMFFGSSVAHAQFEYQQGFSSGLRSIEPVLDNLASHGGRSLWNASKWGASSSAELNACAKSYNRMLNDKVLKVTLAFGYSDNYQATFDPQLYDMTIDALTRSCGYGSQVCGFDLVSGGSSSIKAVLTKNTRMVYNGVPQDVEVRVTLVRSAVSERDAENINGSSPTSSQRTSTSIAEETFFGSLAGRCDACVYYGHARNGGGPDFSPVPYAWRNAEGDPIYSYYVGPKKNYRRMIHSLLAAGSSTPTVVALYACYSQLHFWNKSVCLDSGCSKKMSLRQFAGSTGFILTSEFSWFTNWEKNIGIFLDGILSQKCESSWRSKMSGLNSIGKHSEFFRIYGPFLK